MSTEVHIQTSLTEIDWSKAACIRHDPEIFQPIPCNSKSAKPAKKICQSCIIQYGCLEYALAQPKINEFGIWGGKMPSELKELKRLREAERKAQRRREGLPDEEPTPNGKKRSIAVAWQRGARIGLHAVVLIEHLSDLPGNEWFGVNLDKINAIMPPDLRTSSRTAYSDLLTKLKDEQMVKVAYGANRHLKSIKLLPAGIEFIKMVHLGAAS